MFENKSKRMRVLPETVQESEIDSRERKERHSDRFELADKLKVFKLSPVTQN